MEGFVARIDREVRDGRLPARLADTLRHFYRTYRDAMTEDNLEMAPVEKALSCFLDGLMIELAADRPFDNYHRRERSPFDFYSMGLELFRPLIIFQSSRFIGKEEVRTIEKQLLAGDNVIFLANHQAEPDPQAITLLFGEEFARIAEEMIFVAGHRVTTDPLAKPLSRGRNLLCIYAKRYIDHPEEERTTKQLHNQQTFTIMGQLLREGGKCLFVAPSGGRDRLGPDGRPSVAPFDPDTTEMFSLIAKKAGRPTHFYPMALATYDLLPPPEAIESGLGEMRRTRRTPIHLAIGTEIDMTEPVDGDKAERRKKRAATITDTVTTLYRQLTEGSTT